jgi:HSP20 family molecular chaperone IbpA
MNYPTLRSPFKSLWNVSGREPDIFDSLFANFDSMFGDDRYTDKDGNLIYEIECPGFNKDNLTVDIAEGVLTVKGKRGTGEREREIYKRMAVGSGEKVEAEIKDGILTITFKRPPKEEATKIELK